MKQKLLNSFKLRALMLVAILCAGFTSAWAEDVSYKLTIDANDFNTTSYAANNNEKTSNAVCTTDNTKTYEVTWTSNQVMKNGNNMQWQKSKGYIYNSTDLGTITAVTVTSSAGSFTTYYGTSAQPSSGTTVGGGYFQTKVGGATGTTSKVEVTFTISEGGTTKTPVATIGDLASTTLQNGATGTFTPTITPATGLTSTDYTVAWTEVDNDQIFLTDEGEYIAGEAGSVDKTFNLTIEDNRTDPGLSFSSATASATIGQAFTAPTLNNTNNVTPIKWTSNNEDVATVSNGTITLVGEGTTTITASFDGDNVYSASEASYTLNVTDPSIIKIWSEDFSSYSADDVPSEGTYSYACTGSTKVYDAVLAGGTTPELLVAKNNNTFTAVVPLNNATGTLTLTYKTNAKAMSVSTTTDDISGGGSFNTAGTHTVTFTGVEGKSSITIVFTATSSDNVRLDDIELRGHAQAVLVEAPKFSVVGGTYYTTQSVELSCATDGATIYYSNDGENYSEYSAAIPVATTTTIYAKAEKDGNWSTVSSSTYTIAEKNDVVFNITDKTLAYGETYTVKRGNYDTADVKTDGTVTLESDNAAVTYDGLTITAAAVGTATITITVAEGNSYKSGSTTFTVTVTAPTGQTTALTATPLFYETFNSCDGTGGRDDTFTGNVGTSATSGKLDENWATIGSNGASQCIKLGTGSASGVVKTSNITLTGDGTLTFSAAGWGDTSTNTVSVTATGATLSGDTEFTLTNGEWTNYTVNIKDAEGTIAITFTMKRGFLDDVKVIDNSAADPTIAYTIPSSGLGTFCSEYPLDLANLPDGVKAYAVTAQSTDKVTLTELTEAVKGGVGIIIQGTGGATIQIPSVDSDNVPSNQLVGTLAPTYLAANTAYGLKSGIFQPNNAGNIPAHRAYLPNPTSSVKALVLEFNDVTGITHTRTITDDATIYDLTGRRAQKTSKGIYIINGKKVLVK